MINSFKLNFKFFVSLVFCFQNTAYSASANTENYNDFLVEQYVKDLQGGVTYRDLYGKLKVKNPKDKAFVKELLEKYGDQKIPAPEVNGKELIFNYGKSKVKVEILDLLNEKLKINGYVADLKNHITLVDKVNYTKGVLNQTQSGKFGKSTHPLLLFLVPNEAQAKLITLAVLIGAVGANAIAWRWSYKQMRPDMKPFLNLAEEMQSKLKKCIEEDKDVEPVLAKIDSEFSCKKENFLIKVNDKDCFSREKDKKSSLSKAMDKCCGEDKDQCESTFKQSFPPAQESTVEKEKSGYIYRANSTR